MNKFAICIIYWNDCFDPTRNANVRFCWNHLLRFAEFSNNEELEIHPYLFDFSITASLDDAVHVNEWSDRRGYYRSAKINWVLNYLKDDSPHFFSIIDADVFISESCYFILASHMRNFQQNRFYVFNIKDLLNPADSICFDTGEVFYSKIASQNIKYLNGEPALGGLFFVYYGTLVELGGFDQRFTVWGGEDDEMAHRLMSKGLYRICVPVTAYHLPHFKAQFDYKQHAWQAHIASNTRLPNLDREKRTALFIVQPIERSLVNCFPCIDNLREDGFNVIICCTKNLHRFIHENGYEFYELDYKLGASVKYRNMLNFPFDKSLFKSNHLQSRYRNFLARVKPLLKIVDFSQPDVVYLDHEVSYYRSFYNRSTKTLIINSLFPSTHPEFSVKSQYHSDHLLDKLSYSKNSGFALYEWFVRPLTVYLSALFGDDEYFVKLYRRRKLTNRSVRALLAKHNSKKYS